MSKFYIDKITLAAAANETKCIRENSGHRVQISFDPTSGTVLTNYFVDDNSRVIYHEPIATICFVASGMTEQEIAAEINFAMEHAA